MELALFGATGMIGSRVATEASARGHQVLGVPAHRRARMPVAY